MNFAKKESLKIFVTGILFLVIAILVFYKLNYNSTLKSQLENSDFIANDISSEINQYIIEKVKNTKIIIASPVLINALTSSNNHYQSQSKKKRDEDILQKNNKWSSIKEQNNSFILEYTNNEVSKYFKTLQHNIKGEYGEIFLTNKYGALVASTAKLTTFAHGHKYWWQGAYEDGNGAIFLDDRGYDDSVGGYVLGIVVPIKKDNEIIGILKANINILGSIKTIIVNSQIKEHDKLKLIRSGGLIVFEEGIEPLSKRIWSDLQKKIQTKSNKSFIFEGKNDKYVVGLAEIKISAEMEGYNFGGSFESIDHKTGNTGESWFILDLNPFSNVVEQTTGIVSDLFFMGILLMIVLAIISYIMGIRTAKPLNELIEQTEQISKGDFEAKISFERNDEIGVLASVFNQMVDYLKESTTSIEKLYTTNQQLSESEEKFRSYIENAPVGLFLANQKGKYLLVNQAACEMTGYTEEELLNFSIPDLLQPSDVEKVMIGFQRLPLKESLRTELGYITKTGEHRFSHVNVVKLSDTRYLGFTKDITERKQAEEDVKKYQENLENIVQERTQKLAKQNDELTHMNKLFVGREFRIKELRDQVESLKHEIKTLRFR
jgi:PAS domain S-box-containing protein